MTALRARHLALDAVPVLVSALATGLAAQVTVPFLPVPFTLQTFAVLASGLLLGPRRGAAAMATYLALGAAGLPVFASAGFGPLTLVGPTAGYLWGFVALAALAGWAGERLRGVRLALALGAADLLVLTLGTLWLTRFVGGAAWRMGLLLFLPSEAVKVAGAWATHRVAK